MLVYKAGVLKVNEVTPFKLQAAGSWKHFFIFRRVVGIRRVIDLQQQNPKSFNNLSYLCNVIGVDWLRKVNMNILQWTKRSCVSQEEVQAFFYYVNVGHCLMRTHRKDTRVSGFKQVSEVSIICLSTDWFLRMFWLKDKTLTTSNGFICAILIHIMIIIFSKATYEVASV